MSDPNGVMLHPDKVKEAAGVMATIARDIVDELSRAVDVPPPTPADFGNLNEDAANGQLHAQFSGDALADAREHAERLATLTELLTKYSDAVVNNDQMNRARIAALHRHR
jgi:hypothetical protein